jgi:hypothetical protein
MDHRENMMSFDDKGLEDYVDVAHRIADFREKYPDGSLQPLDPAQPFRIERIPSPWCIECIGRRVIKDGRARGGDGRWVDKWKPCPRCQGSGLRGEGEPGDDVFIFYTAAAYRTPDDPRPGIGVAWEPYPGRTPYTKASEVMNAETSAQGRAIVAALASDSKAGVASREEVRNRRAERGPLPQDEDPWVDQPPGEFPEKQPQPPKPKRTPRSTNGPVKVLAPPGVVGAIQGHFERLGYTNDPADREERLHFTALLAGAGELKSSNDLLEPEGRKAMGELSKVRDRDMLLKRIAVIKAAKSREGDGATEGGDPPPAPGEPPVPSSGARATSATARRSGASSSAPSAETPGGGDGP